MSRSPREEFASLITQVISDHPQASPDKQLRRCIKNWQKPLGKQNIPGEKSLQNFINVYKPSQEVARQLHDLRRLAKANRDAGSLSQSAQQASSIPIRTLRASNTGRVNELAHTELVGVKALEKRVTESIFGIHSPFTSLEGQGGIGKTSICHAAVRHICNRTDAKFEMVLWLELGGYFSLAKGTSIRSDTEQDLVTQLRSMFGVDDFEVPLRTKPYLVVIDNIETEDQAESVMSVIQPLAQAPSRFLLTSRYRLKQKFPNVNAISVPPLNRKAGERLLRQLLDGRGRLRLNTQEVEHILDVVGGIPLAIHLLARLALNTATMSLKDIVDALAQARSGTAGGDDVIEKMFEYLYAGIWNLLSDDTRDLLIALALYSQTLSIAYADLNELGLNFDPAQLERAVRQAQDYYLLQKSDIRYNQSPTYNMHSLTKAYINKQARDLEKC